MRAATQLKLHFLFVITAATTAHAGNNELYIGENHRALHTDSANAVTDSSIAGGSLGYARALNLPVIPRLALWADASFGWGGADGMMFQTVTTEIDTLMLAVGGRARYQLHRLVVASASLDVGTSRASLVLRDSAGHSASDAGWGGMTAGALGLDLFAVNKPRFALGLRLELGYVATSSVSMTATPESDRNDSLHLQMTAASLGSLNLSGSTFAASVISQF